MTPGRNVWVESVTREPVPRVLSRLPVFVPDSGPPDYATHLCRRLSEVSGTDWRVMNPQPAEAPTAG